MSGFVLNIVSSSVEPLLGMPIIKILPLPLFIFLSVVSVGSMRETLSAIFRRRESALEGNAIALYSFANRKCVEAGS